MVPLNAKGTAFPEEYKLIQDTLVLSLFYNYIEQNRNVTDSY